MARSCMASNETAVSISDVTVKGQPTALSKIEYPGVAYAHQGWLTEDDARAAYESKGFIWHP